MTQSFGSTHSLPSCGTHEIGHVASEAGITNGTLTVEFQTLESRRLIRRIPHDDGRSRVSAWLTKADERLIDVVFPQFNGHETLAVGGLTLVDQRELTRHLRLLLDEISAIDALGAS
jgi:DNA-binding MarR family transcriptional regulator